MEGSCHNQLQSSDIWELSMATTHLTLWLPGRLIQSLMDSRTSALTCLRSEMRKMEKNKRKQPKSFLELISLTGLEFLRKESKSQDQKSTLLETHGLLQTSHSLVFYSPPSSMKPIQHMSHSEKLSMPNLTLSSMLTVSKMLSRITLPTDPSQGHSEHDMCISCA